jgi:hypothetical protein
MEAQIRAGHPDLEGLCLALADWGAELRFLERDQAGILFVAENYLPLIQQVALFFSEVGMILDATRLETLA